MNTTENNKLLAEFLGRNGKIRKSLYTWKGIDDLLSGGWIEVEYMKFHTDWNWLMQVVEKIFETADLDNDYLTDLRNVLWDVPNKEEVYNACVSFVKWYNNQK
jgi:hypothetical protein